MTKSKELAIQAIKICQDIEKLNRKDIVDQLSRSSASVGANIREAAFAESRKDFIHKIKIASKELAETEYWIELCQEGYNLQMQPDPIALITELKKLLSASISTAKKNLQSQGQKRT
jgi:four helix bundle protein